MSRISEHDTRLAGQIRALSAKRVLVAVGDGVQYRKILLLVFGRDGSLFVQWPYFHERSGLVANATFRDGKLGGTYKLGEIGKSTSHLVKFAHHTDGEAHFSQDGRVRTEIRRQSFRLDGPIGHLFQIGVYGATGFDKYEEQSSGRGRPEVLWTFPDRMPDSVHIVGEWHRRESLQRLVRRKGAEAGPHGTIVKEETGGKRDVVFIGQPTDWDSRTHLLVLSCQSTQRPTGVEEPFLVFIAGYDEHEVGSDGEKPIHTGALMAMYPGSQFEGGEEIDSIDLFPHG